MRTASGPTALGLTIAASMAMAPVTHAQSPVIGPQIRVDVAGGTGAANETTASASERFPAEIVAAWNDWRETPPPPAGEIIRMGVAVSLDGGQTWTDFVVRPPLPNQSGVEGDPMTAYDDRTGNLWVGAISFASSGGVYVARKAPGSAVFETSIMADVSSSADKCWMVAGPRPFLPETTRLYVGYNQGIIWSDDLGSTWTNPIPLPSGLGFLPRIGPDGEVYIAYWDFTGAGDRMRLARSLDGGQTFTVHLIATRMDIWSTETFNSRFPGTFRVPPLVTLDVDRKTGVLYATYFDTTDMSGGNANVDVYISRSVDQGNTWTTPKVLNGDSNPAGDQFFPWVEVDDESRVHVLYFDSRHTVQADSTVNGLFDAYYAYSEDQGRSWTETRLTPASWNSDDDGLNRSSQFLGDYLGMSVAGRRITPIYLDTSNGDTDAYTNVIFFPGSADLDGDGVVGIVDLLKLLSNWGTCPDCANCPEDLDGDCNTGIGDLLTLLAAWGPVP